ncbi:PilN domain-containing protein [Massilia sp. YIM B02769]|uniref:PilN domain-containing protein n=1 Tax=unclassified Massilia TaxID=2609279 RepID=UPI0025B702AD|nr:MULTISPECIES: PilN domain-containing protein [unclassified Massilia]MDN4059306.1 PilN domain-containing protein [Massilia sp. YIM B02769]
MKRVRLDFARPGVRRALFLAPPGVWGPLFAALVVCGVALVHALDYREAREEVDALQSALRARAGAPPMQPAAQRAGRTNTPVSEQQATAVNAAVMQLNLPWRALHDAVREATPATVALLALEPDARKRVLRITAEARSSDDMIAYVEQLQTQKWFGAVTLVRHEIGEQDPSRPIRFQVDAQWGAP